MLRNIETMREVAQYLEVRNAYIEVDPEWSVADNPPNSCECGNLLTITDRYGYCRECRLGL